MNQKIVIGIPTTGNVDYRFASSLMSLQLVTDTRVIWQPRTMIAPARNLITQKALEDDTYTHLLFIDDDMTFDHDLLLRLLSHNVDIVSALAFKRTSNFEPCVFKKDKVDNLYHSIFPEVFQEIDAAGTAGMLINLNVFRKIPFPWFETYYDDKGKNWSVDIIFSEKAKKEGFKIFVDPNVKMGHIGSSEVVSEKTFLEYNKINKKNVC